MKEHFRANVTVLLLDLHFLHERSLMLCSLKPQAGRTIAPVSFGMEQFASKLHLCRVCTLGKCKQMGERDDWVIKCADVSLKNLSLPERSQCHRYSKEWYKVVSIHVTCNLQLVTV